MKTGLHFFVVFVILSGTATCSTLAESLCERQREELREIKKRIVEELTRHDLPAGSPERRDYLTRLDEQARELLSFENGYWSRYPDAHSPSVSHSGQAFHDVLILAEAYNTNGSRYHHCPDVHQAIEAGLRHFLQFVHADCPTQQHNWWAWDIGIPMQLTPTLFLMETTLQPELLQKEIDTLTYLLKVREDVKLTGVAVKPAEPYRGKTDMNALWYARLRLQYAVLLGNPAMAGKWAELASGEMVPPGEGSWQADFSYKFHGQNPMWTYGNAFIHDYAMIIRQYAGTSFSPTDEQIRLFGTMAEHYYEGFLYKGRICPAFVGRTLSRRENPHFDVHGPTGITALVTLARTNHPRAAHFAALVMRDKPIYADLSYLQENVDAAVRSLPGVRPAAPTNDVFAYPDSDFLQITRPGWAIGIKMHSTRNAGYESINQENLQGWFLSHGSTFHYITGREWDRCWPTLDWTRLPGTTVSVERKGGNQSPFAGVLRASDNCALAAVELKDAPFCARKSWLFAKDHILCVGSDINGPGRVETTVFNQPMLEGSRLLINGEVATKHAFSRTTHADWCWLDNMGYIFPFGQELLIVRESRTSDYTSIRGAGLHGRGETMTHEYLTGVIAHDDQSSSYAYVMIPNATAESMSDWLMRIRQRYAISTDGLHHISTNDNSIESIVFWEAGEAGQVRADRGCLLLREGVRWRLADPAWAETAIHVQIAGKSYENTPLKGRPVLLR